MLFLWYLKSIAVSASSSGRNNLAQCETMAKCILSQRGCPTENTSSHMRSTYRVTLYVPERPTRQVPVWTERLTWLQHHSELTCFSSDGSHEDEKSCLFRAQSQCRVVVKQTATVSLAHSVVWLLWCLTGVALSLRQRSFQKMRCSQLTVPLWFFFIFF